MDLTDTVVVTGTGRVGASPDALVLDLQIEGHGATVPEALDALTRASAAAHAALPDERPRTHGLGVHPRHDHHGRPAGHTAYQGLAVRTSDPAGVGELVRRLSEAVGDALGVGGLRPELTDPGAPQEQARSEAFAQARRRAEQLAGLSGRALGPVRGVREGVVDGLRPMDAAGGMRMAMAEAAVVDPAEQEVVVTLEVVWSLVDR